MKCNDSGHIFFFTCGSQDAGLGTAGSLLNLNLLNLSSYYTEVLSPVNLVNS